MSGTAVLSNTSLSTQMNTRMERALKCQGDAVLERHGITPSQAVRSLWSYMAGHNDIPEYMKAQRRAAQEDECVRVRRLVEEGRGLAMRLAVENGLIDAHVPDLGSKDLPAYSQMEEDMYEEMLDAYHANCV